MNTVQTFLQKIDQIIASVGSEAEAQELKTNLLASLYFDLTRKIGLAPQNKIFLDKMASNPPKTIEDIDRDLNLAQEKLKETGFDSEKAFTESSKDVLENFVSKIEPNLTQEKVVELRKIISK